jgi:hypothetical protein
MTFFFEAALFFFLVATFFLVAMSSRARSRPAGWLFRNLEQQFPERGRARLVLVNVALKARADGREVPLAYALGHSLPQFYRFFDRAERAP